MLKARSSVSRVRVYSLAIPLRKPFEHAAHARAVADPVLVQVELADGTLGYGETLPRPYVSGETVETVITSIQETLAGELLALHPGAFPEALERIDALPAVDEDGDLITAARAGVEMALLDAYSRHFHKPISEAVSWMGLPGFGPPGSIRKARYSGVVSGEAAKLRRSTRLMWWFGLRDFKLKVGYPDDLDRIRTVAEVLGRSLGQTTTLRLDANGAWLLPQAVERLRAIEDLPVLWVEQPLARERDEELVALKQAVKTPILHDESLITLDDARRLVDMRVADGFNIRIGKNGGFLASVRLAHFARKHGVACQLGCLVGETSVLSAAGRHFLENVPGIHVAEGSYGRFLLKGDVVDRTVNLGFGGRPRPMSGLGWGVEVRQELLERHCATSAIEIPL